MARAASSRIAATPAPSTADEVFDAFNAGFRSRKFSAGLLIAFIDMFQHIGTPRLKLSSWEDFTTQFPPLEMNRRGAANTLTISHGEGQITLRRFYDPVETFFRAECNRMDFPNCAPHATQAWGEAKYKPWLDVLVQLSERELQALRQRVVEFVLEELPDHSNFDVVEKPKLPIFEIALREFDMSAQRGERSGAPFQGLVFAFLRTDNPHLQVTAAKVRSGGARHGAVGDVDCWLGAKLTLSAEVKHFTMSKDDAFRELTDFGERIRLRACLGLVVALDFEDGVRGQIERMGLVPLSHGEMINHTRLWEPQKQIMAAEHVLYAYLRLEMSHPLTERFQSFLNDLSERQEQIQSDA